MLQTLHNNSRARQASSLYCVWTTRDPSPGSPLVAIWVDSAMHAFEAECAASTPQQAMELSADEPGGYVLAVAWFFVS